MSVTSETSVIQYVGDGSTTAFACNFKVYATSHVHVFVDGVEVTTGFSVSSVPVGGAIPTVTFSVAPVAAAKVTLRRQVPLTQNSIYSVAGAFPAVTTEKNFDLAIMAVQQIDEALDRAVKLPAFATTSSEFPDPTDPANLGKGVKIADDGSGIDLFNLAATPYTSPLTTKGDIPVQTASATARQPVGANDSLLAADSAQTTGVAWKTPSQVAATITPYVTVNNPIVNGSMDIWQRGTTFAAIASGSYSADRWKREGTSAGVATFQQSTNVPLVSQAGILLNYSLEIDITTADAAVAATDLEAVIQRIEGYNWRLFAQREFTLSFWVMSSKSGTHCVSFRNNGDDRCYVAEYTVNTQNTWEYKTITVPPSPSTGTWNYTTGTGLSVSWVLLAGTNFHTTAGVWQTSATPLAATNAQVNVYDSTSNFFRLTAVNMVIGSNAAQLPFIPVDAELNRCQRYYTKSFPYATVPAQNAGITGATFMNSPFTGTTTLSMWAYFQALMRVAPTVTTYNPSAANAHVRNTTDGADDSGTNTSVSERGVSINFTPNAANTVSDSHVVHWTAEAEL